jgi:hypothetical protein
MSNGEPGSLVGRGMMLAGLYRSRTVLLIAFAFSVMGDPVAWVALRSRRRSVPCMGT